MATILKCRPLVAGHGRGKILTTHQSISFWGGVDPVNGMITDPRHELFDQSITGKILAFPYGKGSAAAPLVLLELAKQAPEKVKTLTGIGTAGAIPVNPALIEAALESAGKAAEMLLQWGFGNRSHLGMSAVPGMQPIAIGRAIMSKNPLATDLQACANYTSGEAVADSLDIPSHLIIAGQDRLTPLKAGKRLAQKLKAQITVIEDYGHMLPIEAPRRCLHRLRESIAAFN